MDSIERQLVEEAKRAAVEVLLHNSRGPFDGLPRTAGWGYPEPYTRDQCIAALGTLASGNSTLIDGTRRVLESLARHQTPHGLISSMAHDPNDLGSSDTTPLFLLALACFRMARGEDIFLRDAEEKAISWMIGQSPSDSIIVAQQPTSDWRDEQWVLGFGLFVNSVVYAYLRMLGYHREADMVFGQVNASVVDYDSAFLLENGLLLSACPYFAAWAYKMELDERFDLLGNSLAILSGLATTDRAERIIEWVELSCERMRGHGELVGELPPNYFPYILPTDPDWRPRYFKYNQPGEYHNGGVWPFVCGFYVAALVATGYVELAKKKLLALTEVNRLARDHSVPFGFNEWIRAQDGAPGGQDWQTWSAAMYLYAAECVEKGETPFFSRARSG